MKKILILVFALFVFLFLSINLTYSACDFDPESGKIINSLSGCMWDVDVVKVNDLKLEWKWFKWTIKKWVDNISVFLWVFAVWAIVYWALLMTLSHWQEDKITKAKDIVKWGMLGFLWVVSASAIITLIIRIMYSI